ncbi:transcription initiation factor IID, subunit [Oesophagostomum dentatum]|uniref:Transcription initiation factor IID, subunit n=1 Tax=Oesophagostomum dentatum TaxID=61180 RepID=A0A0B1SVH2_OESDE|nr:transcription initiation factor IID, subunit [Oesophagostomum dentatum]
MADVWKSQGRKFCEICKVWFGDNRASIEFHERGKKHKAALAAKLRDLGKKSREDAKAKMQMNTALAAMEAAAMKSMREHGEGIPHGPALPETGLASKIFDPRLYKDVGTMARELARRKGELKEMKRSAPPPAPVVPAKYFRRDYSVRVDYPELSIPEPKQELDAVASQLSSSGYSELSVPQSKQELDAVASQPSCSDKVWVEADVGDGSGSKYYFHMYTGESTWDQPLSFYTAEEYQSMFQAVEQSIAKADIALEADKYSVPDTSAEAATAEVQPPVKREQEETDNTSHDIGGIPLPGIPTSIPDSTSRVKQEPPSEDVQDVAQAQQDESGGESAPVSSQNQGTDEFMENSEEQKVENNEEQKVVEKPSVGPFVPDTNAETAAAEVQPPIKREPEEADNASHDIDDIPLPGIPTSIPDSTSHVKQEPSSEDVQNIAQTQQDESAGESAPVSSQNQRTDEFMGNSEEQKVENNEEQKVAEKPSVGPFGGWTKVTETRKEPVFSPLTAKYRAEEERQRKEEAEKERLAEKFEPKVEFTEKTSANLTKKVKGPIEFKKRSAAKVYYTSWKDISGMDEDDDLFSDLDEDDKRDKGSPEDKKFLFRRELRSMLYGFGDDKVPYDKTLETLEGIVLDYIKELCERAMNVGKPDRIALEDIHYLIRRDPKKFARVKDLLSMSEELKKARKQFDDVKQL